jgi:ribonuclease P protein component
MQQKQQSNFGLPKSERIKSKKIIQELFSKKSSSLFLYPYKILYLKKTIPTETTPTDTAQKNTETKPQSTTTQVLVSVSKKYFKRATDRNKIKRRIKEIYRKNKVVTENSFVFIGIIYVASKEEPFSKMEKSLCKLLVQLG